MSEIEKVYRFENLYRAFKAARLGKRGTREEILFEADLSRNLISLSDAIKDGTYRVAGYYSFMIHDPKDRKIHALHFADRVVQHSLCDNVIAPAMEKRLICANAACRIGKGTDFARELLAGGLSANYRKYGREFYVLKCDIRKYFDSIDHGILKRKLRKVFTEPEILALLDGIIDSYETATGKGIPLGNQTSQWFALYYLDGLDRLFKERCRIKSYIRYMDDIVALHGDRELLRQVLQDAGQWIRNVGLSFNGKTQIFPVRNGVPFLGWRFSLNENGKILRRVSAVTGKRFKKAVRKICAGYNSGELSGAEAGSVLRSYCAYLNRPGTRSLRSKELRKMVYLRNDE